MKASFFKLFFFTALLPATVLMSSCDKSDPPTPVAPTIPPVFKPDQTFFGLRAGNSMLRYNTNLLSSSTTINFTGLAAGENVLAIDFRPSTGQLYAITNQSRLYFINTTSGAATAVPGGPITPAIVGNVTGFDFNPTVDRIRILTSSGQNYRVNPNNSVVNLDTPVNPGTPSFSGAAYTNNVAGASSTVLFAIDIANSKLVKFDSPNNGTVSDVAPLGVTAASGGEFDISPDNTVAIAYLNVGGQAGLYLINTATGIASNLGNFSTPLIGIAIPTNPVGYATTATSLVIMNLSNTAGAASKTIAGLAVGETIRGIDFRPATGQLFGLGSTGQVYTFDLGNGAATATAGAPVVLNGTAFGFDWNPTVDRIRVVSNTGQNLRLFPDGSLAATDMPLNPGTPAVSGAAYTNSFIGATTTELFAINHATDSLYSVNPPNDGTLIRVAKIGVNIEANNGFDFGPTTNTAYGVFVVGTAAPTLYRLNTTTGAVTSLGTLPAGVTAFAAGPGF